MSDNKKENLKQLRVEGQVDAEGAKHGEFKFFLDDKEYKTETHCHGILEKVYAHTESAVDELEKDSSLIVSTSSLQWNFEIIESKGSHIKENHQNLFYQNVERIETQYDPQSRPEGDSRPPKEVIKSITRYMYNDFLKKKVPHGSFQLNHPNGNPKIKGEFVNGERDGVWSEFDGSIVYVDVKKALRTVTYDNGKEIDRKNVSKTIEPAEVSLDEPDFMSPS